MNTTEIAAALEQQIRLIDEEKTRLEQALALINGGNIPILVAKPIEPSNVEVVQNAFKKTATTTKAKKKKWTPKTPSPWMPAPHALPWTQSVYDLLADGRPMSKDAIASYMAQIDPSVTKPQLSSCLSHMKNTGRLMSANGLWRRKYARQGNIAAATTSTTTQPASESHVMDINVNISPENVPEATRSDVVAKLDQLASEGKLTKTEQGGVTVYGLNKPTITAKA